MRNTVDEEYLKNMELRKEDVEVLKIWMLKQPHLPKISGNNCKSTVNNIVRILL